MEHIPMTCEKYISTIPKGIDRYDELARRTRDIFAAALAAPTRSTVPTSSEGLPTLDDVELAPASAPLLPEALIEEKFLEFLSSRKGYEHLSISSEEELADNFRAQLSTFNGMSFTDAEWERFLNEFARGSRTVEEKTRAVYSGINFTRDDGTVANIWFQDSSDSSRNIFQVVHQVRGTDTSGHGTRYDVTILMNGLPRVHFELKRQGVKISKAFAQIDRYVSTSFSNSRYDLYGFVSLFVISNGEDTRYYSNTTRNRCIKSKKAKGLGQSVKKDKTAKLWSNTFEWKTTGNLEVGDIISFADTFCDRTSLSYILSDYCTITIDDELFVGKPYQVAATEAMYNKVLMDLQQGRFNGPDANGYIWHATGSGKTFTSFLTARLLARHIGIRTNFMVDRKDLDSQTVREYNRFDRDCVSLSKNTGSMEKKLSDMNQMLVVGIINKMARIVARETAKSSRSAAPLPSFFYLPTVFIFDECHRSQFGNMQTSIQKSFKCYIEFGITGTPIFEQNKCAGSINSTTADIFGSELHRYSITSAIADKAVLPYRVHTVPSRLLSALPEDLEKVPEPAKVYTCAPPRILANARFILDNHAALTKASGSIQVPVSDRSGAPSSLGVKKTKAVKFDYRDHFNAILACDSIPMAAAYYSALETLQKQKGTNFKIAMIYTSPMIEEDDSTEDGIYSPAGIKAEGQKALAKAVSDYNETFSTSFALSPESFSGYYESISDKMKSGDIDVLVVVNMFLTGFDAPCVNTLYIDKPLKWHSLIQALGRTCRTCDAVKLWGEIVCFRDMETEMKEAFALYGGHHAFESSTIEPYADILSDYEEAESSLRTSLAAIKSSPHVSATDKLEYVSLFASARLLRNKLSGYFSRDCCFEDDVSERGLLDENEWMRCQSRFVDYKDELAVTTESTSDDDEHNIVDVLPEDVEFVSELIDEYQIDVDWILELIDSYQEDPGIGSDKYPVIADMVNRQFATSPARKSIMPWMEVLWVTEGKNARDAYMRREYGEMLRSLQRKYPDADKKGIASFVSSSIREGEAPREGEQSKNLFPSGGIKNRRKYRKQAGELVDDVQEQVGKWMQVERVFIGSAPWRKR